MHAWDAALGNRLPAAVDDDAAFGVAELDSARAGHRGVHKAFDRCRHADAIGHLIDVARTLGMTRLSLETGSWIYFHPAHELYRKHGFLECPPFGEYTADPNSIFMTLTI